jgi:hypothetical protein
MTWDQRLSSAVHNAELDLRRATPKVEECRRRVKDLRELVKSHRSRINDEMKEIAERSVEDEKERYLEYEQSKRDTRAKFKTDKKARRLNLKKEKESYVKDEKTHESWDAYEMKGLVKCADKEQDKMEVDLRRMEQELADVVDLQQSAQSIVDQKRDEALAGWAEEKVTRIAMAAGRWYRYEE